MLVPVTVAAFSPTLNGRVSKGEAWACNPRHGGKQWHQKIDPLGRFGHRPTQCPVLAVFVGFLVCLVSVDIAIQGIDHVV